MENYKRVEASYIVSVKYIFFQQFHGDSKLLWYYWLVLRTWLFLVVHTLNYCISTTQQYIWRVIVRTLASILRSARTWCWLTLTVTPWCWAASGGGTAAAARCSTVGAPTATSRTMAAVAIRNNDLTTSGAVAAMVDAWMAGREGMPIEVVVSTGCELWERRRRSTCKDIHRIYIS